jgi:hypothetical protein
MRVLIRSTWSKNIQELTDVCSANHRQYCEKWGYDYLPAYLDYQNYNNNAIADIQGLLDCLKKYDVVMTIGMDTLFMNHNISVRDVFEPYDNVLVAREETGWWPINNDVMIFKSGHSEKLLERMINDFDVWKQYPWRMQTHLWNLMQEEKWVKDMVRLVPAKTMNQHPNHWQLGDWIVHFYNMSLEDKLANAKNMLNLFPDGKPVWKQKMDGVRPGVI